MANFLRKPWTNPLWKNLNFFDFVDLFLLLLRKSFFRSRTPG